MRLNRTVFTDHALREMARMLPVRNGRVVAQGIVEPPEFSARYLVRVVVDVDRSPPEVVTAYRTTKFAKYQGPP